MKSDIPLRLMDSVAKGDRHIYRKVLELVSIAPIPPNPIMLAQLLNTSTWKVKNAVEFWRSHGMIQINEEMLYATHNLN
ncbi:MAG: hypothetical protein ACRC2V_13365 [Xenococcaceae cyanobacterium]